MHRKRTPTILLEGWEGLASKVQNSEERLRAALAQMEIDEPRFARHILALKLYWGFNNEGSVELAEIGRRLGVCSNRARQLRLKAERMLVHPKRWKN